MQSEEERPVGKISDEKPTAVDLGPTAPVVGASCVTGIEVGRGECLDVGNSAADYCRFGNDAAGCDEGNSAGAWCGGGIGAP